MHLLNLLGVPSKTITVGYVRKTLMLLHCINAPEPVITGQPLQLKIVIEAF